MFLFKIPKAYYVEMPDTHVGRGVLIAEIDSQRGCSSKPILFSVAFFFRNVCLSKPFFWKRQVLELLKTFCYQRQKVSKTFERCTVWSSKVQKRLKFYQVPSCQDTFHEWVRGRGKQEFWRENLRVSEFFENHGFCFGKHSVFKILKVLEVPKITPKVNSKFDFRLSKLVVISQKLFLQKLSIKLKWWLYSSRLFVFLI